MPPKGTLQPTHFLPPLCHPQGQAFSYLLPGWWPPSSASGGLCCLRPFSHPVASDNPPPLQIPCPPPPPPILFPDASSSQALPQRLPCVHCLCSASRTQLRGFFFKSLLPVPSPTRCPHLVTPGSRDGHTGDSLTCWAINKLHGYVRPQNQSQEKHTRCLATPTMVVTYGPSD